MSISGSAYQNRHIEEDFLNAVESYLSESILGEGSNLENGEDVIEYTMSSWKSLISNSDYESENSWTAGKEMGEVINRSYSEDDSNEIEECLEDRMEPEVMNEGNYPFDVKSFCRGLYSGISEEITV